MNQPAAATQAPSTPSSPAAAVAATPSAPVGAITLPQATDAKPTAPDVSQETPAVETKKPEDKLAPKFAALARREKEIVEKEKAAAEREKKFQDYERRIKEAEDDPLAALEALGLTYDKLTDHILSGKKNNPDSKAIKELQKKLEDSEKRALEREQTAKQQEEQRILANFKNSQREHIKNAGETYELVNALGRHEDVFEVAQEYYKTHGKVLSHDEAAKLVEDYLEKEIAPFKNVKKLSRLFVPETNGTPQAPAKPGTKPESVSKTQQPKTLSNALSQVATEPEATGPLSKEESLRRAAKLIRFV